MAELIQREDSLNTGREKLNEAIKSSVRAEDNSDYAVETADEALSKSESTQDQLDTIVIDGDSSVEAAQARVDEKGETHQTLKARIDSGFEETKDTFNSVNQQLAQTTDEIEQLDKEKVDDAVLEESTIKLFAKGRLVADFDLAGAGNASAVQDYIDTLVANGQIEGLRLGEKAVKPDNTTFISSSSNLVNEKTVVPGVINADGQLVDSSSYSTSDYIPVKPSTLYTSEGIVFLVFYDEDKNFISRPDFSSILLSGYDNDTFETLSNAYYVRISTVSSRFGTTLQLNEGTELKPFELWYERFNQVLVDENSMANDAVTTPKIKDDAVTSDKRTMLGHLPVLTKGSSGGKIDFRTNEYKLVFDATIFVFVKNQRFTIEAGTEVDFGDIGSVSSGNVVYLDTKTGEIDLTRQTWLHRIPESGVILAIIYRAEGEWHLTINADYHVNGRPKYMPYSEDKGGNSRPVSLGFSIEKITGNYPDSDLPGIDDAENPFDRDTDNHENVYNLFDELIANDPETLSRVEIGRSTKDAPIYAYESKPIRAEIRRGATITEYPKILIDASVHGGESLGTDTLYFFFKRVCEDWQNDATLYYLKNYINLIVVPLTNPDDYDIQRYIDENGVNLNRDFDFQWREQTGSGPHAFSRIESQVMRDFFYEHDDALMYVNMHVRGGWNVVDDNEIMWMGSSNESEIPILVNTIEKLSNKFKQKYPALSSVNGPLGYITNSDLSGTIKSYAHHVVGIPSILWEGFKASDSINDFEGKDVYDMNVDFIGETIVNIIKHYTL